MGENISLLTDDLSGCQDECIFEIVTVEKGKVCHSESALYDVMER